ncbi:hypothetical protein D3C87_1763910 [compost metagenome]
MGRVSNRGGIQHTKRRFDHRPDFQALRCIHFGQKIGHFIDIGRLFHLRQKNRIRPAGKHELQIRLSIWRRERIDADNGFPPAKGLPQKQLFQIVPRLALHIGRDGILQIEDHPVTIEIADFFQRPDINGRN